MVFVPQNYSSTHEDLELRAKQAAMRRPSPGSRWLCKKWSTQRERKGKSDWNGRWCTALFFGGYYVTMTIWSRMIINNMCEFMDRARKNPRTSHKPAINRWICYSPSSIAGLTCLELGDWILGNCLEDLGGVKPIESGEKPSGNQTCNHANPTEM